jgi:glutaredoxin
MALAFGCHRALKLTPKEIEDWHLLCQKKAAAGQTHRPAGTVGSLQERKPAGTPVVIYGAAWCDACHIAADYMKHYGIPYIEKDVEQDENSKATSDLLVAQAGLGKNKSLPVIDVRGAILVGFNACDVEAAWAEP